MYLFMFGLGLTIGVALCSLESNAQSPFLDFGAVPDLEQRQQLQQWYTEKEIRNGRNPYAPKPCE